MCRIWGWISFPISLDYVPQAFLNRLCYSCLYRSQVTAITMAKTMLNLDHNYFIIIYLFGKSLFFNKLHTANRKHISFRLWTHILNKTVFIQSYNNRRGLRVWPILKKFYSDHFTFLNFQDISKG